MPRTVEPNRFASGYRSPGRHNPNYACRIWNPHRLTVRGIAGVDPWDHLQDVLRKLASGWPMSRLAELLPQTWAEQHRQQGHPHAHAAPNPAPG